MKRTWTEVGKEYTEKRQEEIALYIQEIQWHELPHTTGMMAGEGIKHCIKELRIPKVTHIAISNEMAPYGLYGIRGHYKNGMAEIYIVDSGCDCTPICSDFYEEVPAVIR
jgi:hypothetical protein